MATTRKHNHLKVGSIYQLKSNPQTYVMPIDSMFVIVVWSIFCEWGYETRNMYRIIPGNYNKVSPAKVAEINKKRLNKKFSSLEDMRKTLIKKPNQ